MARVVFCLCIFPIFFEFFPVYSEITTYENVARNYDFKEQMEFVPLQDQVVLRVRRDSDVTESPAEKPRATKKPYGFDAKQTTILADGRDGKPSKYNPKEPKLPQEHDNVTTAGEVSTTPRPWQKASGPVLVNMTLPADTEIQITKFMTGPDINNVTLHDHNITSQQEDHHVYYNSTLVQGRGPDYWVDVDKLSGVKISDILSTAHRRAVTVKLSFDFPFYGHLIRNMTIATGGFLYTGEYVHAWLAATQYIAPLMANFDTSLNSNSYVKYADNGTAFIVQWEKVVLQESPHEGTFTFQCILHDTGDIVFVYKNVAQFIDRIEENLHPVKVGLSDAYIIDRTIFFVRRKTIYEYHRVDFKRGDIRNGTAIILTALDTCLDMTNCHACVSALPRFQCNWCGGRCSNGMDRHRQDWLQRGCEAAKLHSTETCPSTYEPEARVNYQSNESGDEEERLSIAGVIGIFAAMSMVLVAVLWVLYAYRNPHTPSGQIIIRYRPSVWTWRRGEARYTAATIHM